MCPAFALTAAALRLPDLPADPTGSADTILALQAVLVAHELEAVKVFDVTERLVQLFQRGRLPLGSSAAAKLTDYRHRLDGRLSFAERQALYLRALGLPVTDGGAVTPNREFQARWQTFVAAVTRFRPLAEGAASVEVTRAQGLVGTAAHDLALTAAQHGGGITYLAARELASQLNDAWVIISEPGVCAAVGGHDSWHLVERLATQLLGSVPDVARARSRAISSAVILRWLATHAGSSSSASGRPPISADMIRRRTHARDPISAPTDADLALACDAWMLARR